MSTAPGSSWDTALSGGTDACNRDHGEVHADGRAASSNAGFGYFRAVLAMAMCPEDAPWEGSATCVAGADGVHLFLCRGKPDADTSVRSRSVCCFRPAGAWCLVGGEGGVCPCLDLSVGQTLWWRFDPAEGTLEAGVVGGAPVRVFEGFGGGVWGDVFCGFFLSGHAQVRRVAGLTCVTSIFCILYFLYFCCPKLHAFAHPLFSVTPITQMALHDFTCSSGRCSSCAFSRAIC